MAAAYRLPDAICAQSEAQRRAFETRRGLSVAGVVPNACALLPAAALTPASARRSVLWVGCPGVEAWRCVHRLGQALSGYRVRDDLFVVFDGRM